MFGGMGRVIFFATGFAVFVTGVVGLLVVLLLIPGRKGFLRRRKEVELAMGAGEAYDLIARRLAGEGFQLDARERPARLLASRGARPVAEGNMVTITHATRAISLVCEFAGHGETRTRITVAARLGDFTIYDSGEGRQMEALLHWLTSAEDDAGSMPQTPGLSIGTLLALSTGAVALAALWLAARRPLVSVHHVDDYVMGAGVGAGTAVAYAWQALRQIRSKPGIVTGWAVGLLGLAVGVIGVVVAVALLVAHWTGRWDGGAGV